MTHSEAERLRRRRRRRFLYRLRQRVIECGVLLAVAALVFFAVRGLLPDREAPGEDTPPQDMATDVSDASPLFYPVADAATVTFDSSVDAQYAVLIDVTEGRVVAQRGADVQVYPASVTKMLTLLTAVEYIEDYTDTYEMSYEFLDSLYWQGATVAGFSSGEQVTLMDMMYGCILPSGADATIGLANYIAGSEADFAVLMNQKAEELGLKNTHFVNSSGLHDSNHYTTALDMAVVLAAAMENDLCRQVLSAYQYTTSATPQHPEGLLLTSTMFSRMYGDEPEGALIIAGKTGYTSQAGHTMASYAQGEDGHDYIFVSMKGSSKWKATYDAINVYTAFCAPAEVPEDVRIDE